MMSTLTATPVTRDQSKPPRGVGSEADRRIVGAICGVVVLLPALVSLAAGSFSLPQNDDWSYRRTAEHFAQTGHVVLTGWGVMTLIGQILWSWPFLRLFGDHGWVFGISTAVLAVIGISCAYYVARRLLEPSWAAAAVLLVAAVPGFAWSTSTFMTDVPAFAAETACLALGAAALSQQGSPRWSLLGGAMAVGFFGFSIREFALAAPIAVLLCAGASDSNRRRWYVAAGFVGLAVCFVLYWWSTRLPGSIHQTITGPSGASIVGAAHEYYTLAFMVSPVVALAAWRRMEWRLSRATLTAFGAFVLGAAIAVQSHVLILGNYLQPLGFVGAALLPGARPTVLPAPLWDLLNLVGLVSGGLLAGIAVAVVDRRTFRRWRAWEWGTPICVVWVFGAVYATGVVLYGSITSEFYDRYLWPLVFVLAVLLLHYNQPAPRREWPRVVDWIVVTLSTLLVLATTALTINADTYSAARWRAGQIAVSHGVPAKSVDAGMEWVGAHATGVVNKSLHPTAPAYEPWYALVEPGFRDCAVVSGSLLNYPTLDFVKTMNYKVLGLLGSGTLYIYISSAPGC